MDQFPDEIIENIFSYLIDSRLYYKREHEENFIIINCLRLVCQRFINLEQYLTNRLVLGYYWTNKAHELHQNNHSFWKKNLPHVRHLTFSYVNYDSGCYKFYNHGGENISMLTCVKSLNIRRCWVENFENLTQLEDLYCEWDPGIYNLTKTNVHNHEPYINNKGILINKHNECRKHGCLIRHRERV